MTDPPTSADAHQLGRDECVLWAIMRTFEVQAIGQYQEHTPQLAVPKDGVGALLVGLSGDDRLLDGSVLGASMPALVASASEARREDEVLVIQGLVLERVRQVVYSTVAGLDTMSERSRSMAAVLQAASAAVVALAPPMFAATCRARGQQPFSMFAEASDDVLHKLDSVGEGVDEVFGSRFGLRFADILGDFVADLVPTCVDLGMERRKVMSHLASALMGL
jgi:hypothetical protein